MNEINLGQIGFSDKGEWRSGYTYTDGSTTVTGYAKGDVVHTTNGVFASQTEANTTDPNTKTTNRERQEDTPGLKTHIE